MLLNFFCPHVDLISKSFIFSVSGGVDFYEQSIADDDDPYPSLILFFLSFAEVSKILFKKLQLNAIFLKKDDGIAEHRIYETLLITTSFGKFYNKCQYQGSICPRKLSLTANALCARRPGRSGRPGTRSARAGDSLLRRAFEASLGSGSRRSR